METIFVCYQVDDDFNLVCVGTDDTRTGINDFAYTMSRRYDFDYIVYVKTFNPDTGLYEEIYLYDIYNGKVRW